MNNYEPISHKMLAWLLICSAGFCEYGPSMKHIKSFQNLDYRKKHNAFSIIFFIDQKIMLPIGQGPALHCDDSIAFPMQFNPPYSGAGLLQDRLRL